MFPLCTAQKEMSTAISFRLLFREESLWGETTLLAVRSPPDVEIKISSTLNPVPSSKLGVGLNVELCSSSLFCGTGQNARHTNPCRPSLFESPPPQHASVCAHYDHWHSSDPAALDQLNKWGEPNEILPWGKHDECVIHRSLVHSAGLNCSEKKEKNGRGNRFDVLDKPVRRSLVVSGQSPRAHLHVVGMLRFMFLT